MLGQPEPVARARTTASNPDGRSADADAPPPGAPGSRPEALLGGLDALIASLPEPILVTDGDGLVRLTNDAADRLFAEQPVRSDGDLLSRFEEAVTDGRARKPGRSSQRLLRPRHQPNTWFSLDQIPLQRTAGASAAYVLRDVTNSRDLRAEREAFLAVLSHELRTPLTTIYAGSSVLARRPRLSPPATRTLAVDISLEAARLYDLVENLLVIARLERRILDLLDEPVDLGRALEGAMRLTADRFPDAEVDRVGDAEAPPVHGDATYVEQSCRNLIVSMIRAAGRPDSRLVVQLDVDRASGEVAVRAHDDGPPLTADQVSQAFDLPTATSEGRFAGVGLGLFVVRHAVQAMGGRSWARNVGDGVEVGFALRIHDGSRAEGRRDAGRQDPPRQDPRRPHPRP
jgi:signal transduction histidine kinase